MPLKNFAPNSRAGNAHHFRGAVLWLAVCVLLTAFVCRGEEAKPDVAPPSSWVVPIPFDVKAHVDAIDPSEEMRWLLKDQQINALTNETFTHEVRQVLTPSGVRNGSHISVAYDPGFQTLVFHWVKIWRGTNRLDRLDPDKIQISQHGLDTDDLLFSNEKTATLLLDDVRMGDIIDYAYSVQGENPAFGGRFFGEVEAQEIHPIERMTTRLLWPVARRLYVKNHGTDVKYTAVRKGDLTEFTWNFKRVTSWRSEPPLPIWYHPFPWVQLSEFQKWSDVDQWAFGLFDNKEPPSPELARKISEWKHLPDPEERVLAALRFVQDEVRYLGIESGASGYSPATPSTVFARRFGDCKDKTCLLTAMLRALGVEAWPVLVNTTRHQGLFDLHPSATDFDHVITQIKLDGQNYWLDATANYQRGPLAVRSWRNYSYGLTVRPGTKELTPITPSAMMPKTTVTQYIRLGNLDQASDLKVVTVAEGPAAERLREEYSTTARDEIERANVNYYARYYPDIAQTAPIIYTDDEQQNKIEVDEFYSIRKIWRHLPDETFFHCRVYPVNVGLAMKPPLVSLRTMPLGVRYPEHQIFRAEVIVPVLAVLKPDDQTIENPAFYFHRAVTIGDGKLFLSYEYRSLADAVLPEAVPAYVRQLDSAAEVMSYTISSD